MKRDRLKYELLLSEASRIIRFDCVYLLQTELKDSFSKVVIFELMHEMHRFYAGKIKNCDRPVFYRFFAG